MGKCIRSPEGVGTIIWFFASFFSKKRVGCRATPLAFPHKGRLLMRSPRGSCGERGVSPAVPSAFLQPLEEGLDLLGNQSIALVVGVQAVGHVLPVPLRHVAGHIAGGKQIENGNGIVLAYLAHRANVVH